MHLNTRGLADRASRLHTDLIHYFDGEGEDLKQTEKTKLREVLRRLDHYIDYQLHK